MKSSFDSIWRNKVELVHGSNYYRKISLPPDGHFVVLNKQENRDEVRITSKWEIRTQGNVRDDGPTVTGIKDLRGILSSHFGITLLSGGSGEKNPEIIFTLLKTSSEVSRWERSFQLTVTDWKVEVKAETEEALLRGSLWLSNYWRLRRTPCLRRGKSTVKPGIPVHISSDVWGGFNTTQKWIPGREEETNFLEMARMGVNVFQIMVCLEDMIDTSAIPPDAPKGFQTLINRKAAENRRKLAELARQSAKYDLHLMIMAYNPHLPENHPLFKSYPDSRGQIQNTEYYPLCSSDPKTLEFLSFAWASLFREIPELGGIMMISGGEGFTHCFMRGFPSGRKRKTFLPHPVCNAADCPRCSKRNPEEVVAELVNSVSRKIHEVQPDALCITWPYAASVYWAPTRDQEHFIECLDSRHVIFQTEIDKDTVEWRAAGYGRTTVDYSTTIRKISERCLAQRKLCRKEKIRFSCKLECNISLECISVPWLPVMKNLRIHWRNCRSLRPYALQSKWLFGGICKSPSEELGFWTVWGDGTEFADLEKTLKAIACRDYGDPAAPAVLRAWTQFSDAFSHHPQLGIYYMGSAFIGCSSPLVFDPDAIDHLDRSFFGYFYWALQEAVVNEQTYSRSAKALFFTRPYYNAIARRGGNRGKDVALEELKTLAGLWQKGCNTLDRIEKSVPDVCREKFKELQLLSKHLCLTWRSAANVEEFLRLRDMLYLYSERQWEKAGYCKENLGDLKRMEEIAREELSIAREDLKLVRDVDFLNIELRLDMGCASTATMLEAKIKQVEEVLEEEIPKERNRLSLW